MKTLSTQFTALFVLLLFCNLSWAQTQLKGVVTDGSTPLAGASILIKGSSAGTSTDRDGAFTLRSPSESGTLSIRVLGYLTREVSFSAGTTDLGRIVLEPDDLQSIGEVVVVGKG